MRAIGREVEEMRRILYGHGKTSRVSSVGLVANFKDRVRRKLSAFRCGLGGCMEEIKQHVRTAQISGNTSSAGSAGRCRAAHSAAPRSHSERACPAMGAFWVHSLS
ncbi:MAG: hypothetical protein ABSG70_13165 [Terriglobales bacterium]|jgi:hypothetical protein